MSPTPVDETFEIIVVPGKPQYCGVDGLVLPFREFYGLRIARRGDCLWIWEEHYPELKWWVELTRAAGADNALSLEEARQAMLVATLRDRRIIGATISESPERPDVTRLRLEVLSQLHGHFWVETYLSHRLICDEPLIAAEFLGHEVTEFVRKGPPQKTGSDL